MLSRILLGVLLSFYLAFIIDFLLRHNAFVARIANQSINQSKFITGSAVALYCCKAHSKSIGKKENSTPCKIVTPENFHFETWHT